MTKQELARARNYFKFVLMGLNKPINLDSLTEGERRNWNELLIIRDSLLMEFNNCSKIKGLNVPDKCWCGKVAKYKPEEGEYPIWITKVCKNHIKYD